MDRNQNFCYRFYATLRQLDVVPMDQMQEKSNWPKLSVDD